LVDPLTTVRGDPWSGGRGLRADAQPPPADHMPEAVARERGQLPWPFAARCGAAVGLPRRSSFCKGGGHVAACAGAPELACCLPELAREWLRSLLSAVRGTSLHRVCGP